MKLFRHFIPAFVLMITVFNASGQPYQFVMMSKRAPLSDGTALKPDRPEHLLNERPLPNKRQLAWQNAEMGVLISYDLHVFDGKRYVQRENRITPVPDYNIFNPKHLDTDQWIQAVKAMGAKFAILTATHETGFALYQSDVNPYCMKALKWKDGKGDIVRDFVNSCRKNGIQPGIYLGIRWNSFFGVHNFRVEGEGQFRENRQDYYNHMVEGMVKEVCTRYGNLFEIWFDGGADSPDRGAPDVLPIVKQYQPHCLFYHNAQLAEARWGGSESGTVPYPCRATFPYPSTDGILYPEINKNNYALLKQGDPDGKYWMPAMSDAPLRGYNGRHEWFWEPGDESHIFPVQQLMKMYLQSVGHNSTLILGITPDTSGQIPGADVQRMKEFGEAIRERFAKPLASASGENKKLVLTLPHPQAIHDIVLMEDISKGERVRQFSVEGYKNGKWITLFEGTCIGHKLIIPVKKQNIGKLRLHISRSTDAPSIRTFSVF